MLAYPLRDLRKSRSVMQHLLNDLFVICHGLVLDFVAPFVGKRVGREFRVFLDELPANAKGRALATMDLDCGIFCEER